MRTSVVVIGAGQAGLAMSWWLAHHGIDHVVLERGRVAESWRTQRWDSLTLLTPNWQSRLPGHAYRGDDPDGYRTMPQTIAFLEDYARLASAPVRTGTTVTSARRRDDGYDVATDQGSWRSRAVVLASGAFNVPVIFAVSQAVSDSIVQVTADRYRNPAQLPEGGVLVVGAAASGAQIADEIQRAGRPVTLAVGEHVRAPRVYRGRDTQWWMDASGLNDERYDQMEDIARARSLLSFQLAGCADRRNIDLNALSAIGVRLVGRLAGIGDGKAQFSGSLRNVCKLADLKMNRLLNTLDAWAGTQGLDAELAPVERFDATRIDPSPVLMLDLQRAGNPQHRMGHRAAPGSLVARHPGVRPQGQRPPRRRRGDRFTRPVRAEPAVPAPAQVQPDPRRGRRCARAQCPSRCISGAFPRHAHPHRREPLSTRHRRAPGRLRAYAYAFMFVRPGERAS